MSCVKDNKLPRGEPSRY